MAKSIEQLQKEADAAQAKAMAAKTKLKEAERVARKKHNAQERKDDTRRKILLGGFVMARLKNNSPQAQYLHEEFLDSLTKEADKKLFDDHSVEAGMK